MNSHRNIAKLLTETKDSEDENQPKKSGNICWRAWFFLDNLISTACGSLVSTSALVTAYWELNELYDLPSISEAGIYAGLPLAIFFAYSVAKGHDTEAGFIDRHAKKEMKDAEVQTDMVALEASVNSHEEKIISPVTSNNQEFVESIIAMPADSSMVDYANLESKDEEQQEEDEQQESGFYSKCKRLTCHQRMIAIGHTGADILGSLTSVILFGEAVAKKYDFALPYRMLCYGGVALWKAGANNQETLNIINGFVDEARVVLEM